MRIFISFLLASTLFGTAQASVLFRNDFYRLNETDIKIKSYFVGNPYHCYHTQYRFEYISNDTLFLKILFETRIPSLEGQCIRYDTISATQNTGFSFINISTFNAQLSIPEFGNSADLIWNISNGELTIVSEAPIQSVELVDLNGKTMLYTKANYSDVAFLETGVYLMRVLTASETYKTIRWFRY